jgi:phosphomannomutase
MMDELIISVSGMRGIVGGSLTPEKVASYVRAFASTLSPGPLVVSRDGRANAGPIVEVVCKTLQQQGRDVLSADIAATPTAALLVREQKAAGGIQVSASHNPPEYNGLKLLAASGRMLPASKGEVVLERYRQATSSPAPASPGRLLQIEQVIGMHMLKILETVDSERIRSRQFRVLLDSNRGAGSLLGRPLLEELGCQLTILGETPDGHFEHPAEPTAAHLAPLTKQLGEGEYDVVFCQDPDADRLAIIGEQGRYLGEELTLAICLDHVLTTRTGAVVTNCSSSRASEEIARRHDVPFFQSAVGEANVVDLMLEKDACFGGEGNGGVIDPRVVLARDSFVGMAQVLDAMAASEETVSQLANRLPRFQIHKGEVPLSHDLIETLFMRLQEHFPQARVSTLDGLRLDWNDRWLLVRASNTEPIVRCIAESSEQGIASALCDQVVELADQLSS